jgi:ferredoxin
MNTEIYYFSGTGNSLFVAKELQKRLSDSNLIPIIRLLNEGKSKANGKIIGVVFPVHALTVPVAVIKFLRKLDLSSAEYIFIVATRMGIIFNDFKTIHHLLKKKNKKLNAHFLINMYSNDSKDENYQTPTKEQIKNLEIKAIEQIDIIIEKIKNKKNYLNTDTSFLINHPYNRIGNYVLEKVVISLLKLSEFTGGVNYFYHDLNCNSCGICEKVCLSKKIKIINNRPAWSKEVFCYMCYACINFCPESSIQIKDIPGVKSYTEKVGRYNHPYARIKDLSFQKSLNAYSTSDKLTLEDRNELKENN